MALYLINSQLMHKPVYLFRLLGVIFILLGTFESNAEELPKTKDELDQATKQFTTIVDAVADQQTRYRYVQQEAPALGLAASLLGETETSWEMLGRLEEAEHGLNSRVVQVTLPATVAAMHRQLKTFGYRECEMFFNGRWAGPAWGMTHFEQGDHRRQYSKPALTKSLATDVDKWFHIRIQCQDGIGRMFANGHKLFEEPLSAYSDPWIGARSWHRYHGGIRDVRITGTPEIPSSIAMVHDVGLTGWTDYYDVQNFARLANWHFDGEELTGLKVQNPENANYERLLRYHRPMIEDGHVEYEFFYQPERFHVSPVLDRLAFLLDTDAVRIHWCTDGAYDRTGLSQLNVADEPKHQLTAGKLPLIENDWNRMKLVLVGNEVELVLNEQPIFRRKLEPSNMRRLGLFYFPGQTQARLRNVVWTGNWPKQLPQ